ncbi:hypothetical protein E2C01_054348 [Portunus trituberculatus]|uniref:Uncharacterized protein n=1 Tax=Portunus trituberculatus TaxID=210409 RepID=A0A5B7GSY4_PORTR|nr:hypothetical protein [Portunus trituberculatus]
MQNLTITLNHSYLFSGKQWNSLPGSVFPTSYYLISLKREFQDIYPFVFFGGN